MSNDNWFIGCGLVSCAIGGLLYRYYGNRHAYYHVLKNIKCYNVDDDLQNDLREADNRINYAAVTGFVAADKDFFTGANGDKGVIRHDKILQHSKEWNSRIRVWMKNVRELSAHTEFKPFHVTNRQGNISVNVCHPLEVDHPITDVLSQTYQEFEPIDESLVDKVVNVLSSSYTTGFEKIELMLLTGSQITVLGEIEKNSNGISLKPPESHLKYVITKLSLGKAKENELFWLNFWKYATIFFAGLGLTLFSVVIYRRVKKYRDERLFQRLADENTIEETSACIICMENRRNVVFLPCGHICVCKHCGDMCETCPICRVPKQRLIPTFVS